MYTFLRVFSIVLFLGFFNCLSLILWAYLTHNRDFMVYFAGLAVAVLATGFILDRQARKIQQRPEL